MRERRLELQIFRFRPDLEESETWDDVTLICPEKATVLDALIQVQRERDASLAFRWSCRTGQCGACGISVNGTPVLACEARLDAFKGLLRIAPLSNLLIIRDLICALESFEEGLLAISPAHDTSPASQPSSQDSEPIPLDGSECIECGLCHAACPAVERRPDFVGPAALARAWEVMRGDSSTGDTRRLSVLASDVGVWNCGEGGECSAVCPRGVHPASAASGIKLDFLRRSVGLGGWKGGE